MAGGPPRTPQRSHAELAILVADLIKDAPEALGAVALMKVHPEDLARVRDVLEAVGPRNLPTAPPRRLRTRRATGRADVARSVRTSEGE